MATLMAFPVLVLALMLQTAVISRINLLYGSADLILVILAAWALQERVTTSWQWAVVAGVLFAFVSGLPWFVPLAGYLLIVGVARLLQRRVWQAPLLAMFTVSLIGTLMLHILSISSLRLLGNPLPVGDSFSLITLPSILLNLLLAIPIYAVMRDLAGWLYPVAVEA
jgi:cell shape-determining protein MreD